MNFTLGVILGMLFVSYNPEAADMILQFSTYIVNLVGDFING